MELCKLLLLLTFCLTYLTRGAFGQFSFIPSPNITILQSAVYRCNVNEGNPLTWTVNGISSATTAWQPYIDSVGITLGGLGANNGVLTIPGNNITLNGSTIECAYGIINGIVHGDSDNSTLYIQGPPSTVGVTCQFQSPSFINCSWSTPFTLPGINITHYVVNTTNNDGHVVLENTTNTQYGCSTEQLGLYTISVTPYINELEGETDSTQLTLFNSSVSLYHDDEDSLIMNVLLVGLETLPNEAMLSMKSVNRSGNYSIHLNYGSIPVSGVVNVTNMSRIKNVSVDIYVYYDDDWTYNSINNHLIDTFDVENLTYETISENATSDKMPNLSENSTMVCFNCIFNPFMRNPRGCNISYTSTNEEERNLVETKNNGSVNTTQRVCSNVSHEYPYDIRVYDIRNNILHYEEPAVELYNVLFTSLNIQINANTGTITSTTTSSVTSSVPTSTSTSSYTTPTTPIPTSSNTIRDVGIITVLVVTTLIICLVLIVVIAIILSLMIAKRNKHPPHPSDKSQVPSAYTLESVSIKSVSIHVTSTQYSQTAFEESSDRPKPRLAPNGVSYSDVQKPNNDEYSTLNHHQPTSVTQNNNDYDKVQRDHHHPPSAGHQPTSSLYSTLNNNQDISSTDNPNYSTLPGQVSRSTDGNVKLTYKLLKEILSTQIPHKWQQLGQALALSPDKLQEIRDNHPCNDGGAFNDVLQEWQTSEMRPFTLKTLKSVLKSIGEGELIQAIESRL